MDEVVDAPDMEQFFNQIVELTDNSSSSLTLKKISDSIIDLVTKDCKKNIQIAALRGFNEAYLCLYDVNAKYKGCVPIDCFIHMSEHTRAKFEEHKIEPVMDRLRRLLLPFRVEVRFIDMTVPGVEPPEAVVLKDFNGDPIQVVAIVATWPKTKPEQKTNVSSPLAEVKESQP